jgi:ZIP family zinc transporter
MGQALLYSAISAVSLIAGALIGTYFKLKQKMIARFMAFGSGVLICALTFGLMEEAFKHGGFDAVVIGFLCGGITFILGDYLIHLKGGRHHKGKHTVKNSDESNGAAIALGSTLDGIPESVALGIAIFNGAGTGILILVAIVLSNIPESISSIGGLRKEGFNKKNMIGMWAAVGIATGLATFLSYIFLNDLSLNNIGILESFAAGAILAMLTDSMMPEAYEEGGFSIGFLTILGFLTAFIISRL